MRGLLCHSEPDLNVIGDRRPVWRVVEVEGDITSGLDQLGGLKLAVIGGRIAGQIAVLGHASETAAGSGWAEGRHFPWKRASFIVTRFVLPYRIKILDVRVVGIKTETDMVGHSRVLGFDLNRSDPGVLLEPGRNGDGHPFDYVVLRVGRNIIGWSFDDDIRRDLPALGPFDSRRRVLRGSLEPIRLPLPEKPSANPAKTKTA